MPNHVRELGIIIPTYNEKDNIGPLIENIRQALPAIDYEIIVVDDRSPDGTGDAVQRMAQAGHPVRLISKERKEGIGAALRVGYQACTATVIASTDADLSFDAQDLARLYRAIQTGLDVVVGTRHSAGSFYETPNRAIWLKHAVSLMGNRTLRALTGIPVDDFSGNFRAFTQTAWQNIATHETTNTLLFEMILKAYVKGYAIGQLPVAFHNRRYGASKLKLSMEAPKFLFKLLKYLAQYWPILLRRRIQH
jgi:dolichol-phosphate mannosyltransferase